MTIFLTGCAGFIGNAVAFALLERGDAVIHLAAQPGVCYSLENPQAYIDSNITGTLNIFECCRNFGVKNIVYASSSSVYGENAKIPFNTSNTRSVLGRKT